MNWRQRVWMVRHWLRFWFGRKIYSVEMGHDLCGVTTDPDILYNQKEAETILLNHAAALLTKIHGKPMRFSISYFPPSKEFILLPDTSIAYWNGRIALLPRKQWKSYTEKLLLRELEKAI